MNQDVFHPPTVFNYYPADYLAPGTPVLGPEFGILTTVTALRRANIVNTLVFNKIPVSANSPAGHVARLLACSCRCRTIRRR